MVRALVLFTEETENHETRLLLSWSVYLITKASLNRSELDIAHHQRSAILPDNQLVIPHTCADFHVLLWQACFRGTLGRLQRLQADPGLSHKRMLSTRR